MNWGRFSSWFACAALLFLGRLQATTLYVAPEGRAGWSGSLPAANFASTDGPLPSLEAVRDRIRALRAARRLDGPVEVRLRAGVYPLDRTFVVEPQDSGSVADPVTYTSYPGETAVISGGTQLTDWHPSAEGKKRLWSAQLPRPPSDPAEMPRQLFIQGDRALRARTPHVGFLLIPGNSSTDPLFQLPYSAGTISPAWAGTGAEAVVLLKWAFCRRPIIAVDPAGRIATLAGDSGVDASNGKPRTDGAPGGVRLKDTEARYYLENVREALDSEREWFYERESGRLLYWPRPSEDMAKDGAVVTRLATLVRLARGPEGAGVQHVVFRGLSFAYSNWYDGPSGFADEPQGAVHVAAAFAADGARNCAVEHCTFSHLGGYGIAFEGGATSDRIEHNLLFDLGAGGVRLGVFNPEEKADGLDPSSDNVIADNVIHHIGEVYPSAVGILVGQSGHNLIAHNLVHDTYYTAISVGWTWGYDRNPCHDNIIEYNEVHHLMRGLLDDGGGIYTLGPSPGTIIRHNVVHDIESSRVRGRGIYLDEGSTGILVENNVVYRVKSASFHVHYGRENIVRNNIFALAQEYQITRPERDPGRQQLTFEHNLVYFDSGRLLGRTDADEGLTFDHNLYFDTRGEPLRWIRDSLSEWRARGQDRSSLIADPCFVDPARGDFSLRSDSPAPKIGFVAIDVSGVGPREISP